MLEGKIMKRFLFALIALVCTHNSAAADCTGGAYFSGIGGVDFLHLNESEIAKVQVDAGLVLGATIGYQFCSGFALECELAYRRQKYSNLRFRKVFDFPGLDIQMDGLSEATTIMANILYHMDYIQFCLPYVGAIVPYVGIGLGYAHTHELSCLDLPFSRVGIHACDDTLAYQAIFGLSTAISCCTDLGIEYRRMRHHQDTYNQSVNLVVKRYF